MAAWVLIPCLVELRGEFNVVAPRRDKGADGAIGDSSHTSSSDHTPDEDSDVLRDHDADHKNEVHALDIDSDGPWPDGSGRGAGGWFDRKIRAIAARERAEYLHPTMKGRLQYIIWRGQIISRSWGWSEWRNRSQNDHYDHAHFSARYLTETENDTRPWGVIELKDEDMPLNDADKTWITNAISSAVRSGLIGQVGDVVPRWSESGGQLAAGDSNPEMTPASALFYIGATARRAENLVADTRERMARVESSIVTLSQAVSELSSRQGQPISEEMLLNAVRRVLREGVSE